MLTAEAALFAAACAVLVFAPSLPVTAALVFVAPVAIIASELGTHPGPISAGLIIAAPRRHCRAAARLIVCSVAQLPRR